MAGVLLLSAGTGCSALTPTVGACGEEHAIARGLAWIGASEWESLSVQAVRKEWPTPLEIDDSCLQAEAKCDLATLAGPIDGGPNDDCGYIVDFRLSASVDGGNLAGQVGLRGVFVNQTFSRRGPAVNAVKLWFGSQPIPPDQFPRDADFEGEEVSASWLRSGARPEFRSVFAEIVPVGERWQARFRLARADPPQSTRHP